MANLLRTRQATYTIHDPPDAPDLTTAITYVDLEAGEDVWGLLIRPQLEAWVEANPVSTGHVNGRSEATKQRRAAEQSERPKQRFRGGHVADTKKERIKQQGGKYKGKWSRKVAPGGAVADSTEKTIERPENKTVA